MSDRRAWSGGGRRGAALFLSAAFTPVPGCLVHHPTSYATPLDAVLTFQSAFAHGDEVAEYAALAQSVKHDVTLQGYATFRARLLEPLGSFGRSVLRHNSLCDNLVSEARVRDAALLQFALLGHHFFVVLELDPWLEVAGGGTSGAAPPAAPLQPAGNVLLVETEFPAAFVERLRAGGIDRVELRGEWKVAHAGDAAAEDLAGEAAPCAGPDPVVTWVQEIPLRVLAEDLGSTRVQLELPAGPEHQELAHHGVPAAGERWIWRRHATDPGVATP